MHSSNNKLRILAIHGYRQSDVIFSGKLGSLRKGFKKELEFTFVKAPHQIPVALCEENSNVDGTKEDENGYGWWFNTEERIFKATEPSEICVGFENSITLIEETFKNHGPFDGILGFSQGAAFASILCVMQEKKLCPIKFDFAIIISGFKSLCAPHSVYYDTKINIPSLHIYGQNDKVIPTDMAQYVYNMFKNGKRIIHEGGHYIPSKKDIYKDFFTEMLLNKSLSV